MTPATAAAPLDSEGDAPDSALKAPVSPPRLPPFLLRISSSRAHIASSVTLNACRMAFRRQTRLRRLYIYCVCVCVCLNACRMAFLRQTRLRRLYIVFVCCVCVCGRARVYAMHVSYAYMCVYIYTYIHIYRHICTRRRLVTYRKCCSFIECVLPIYVPARRRPVAWRQERVGLIP